ncbi:protein phosphatase 2C domain-containing protein [Polymorphospora sp. NPDC050346]|uniref:protein phosphatase 2C domain-containing protein n=1 Tax=Polymorphospora sp. NPDC050346 TaxID=3155780 RepID=UPI0033E6E50B
MQIIQAATTAAPDRARPEDNEDAFRVGPDWALVLDGAGRYPGVTGGCVHPITWIVTRLAHHIGQQLATDEPVTAVLHTAINATMADHGPECDLTDPLSPGATVAFVRARGEVVDWLVLGDCVAMIERLGAGCEAVIDDRVDQLDAPVVDTAVRTYDPAHVAQARNRPGGFWVAGAVPEAAEHALVGSADREDIARVMLCSDGVSRLIERYGWSWPNLLNLADRAGSQRVFRAIRQAEQADPDPRRWRGKRHDDATLVLARITENRP